MKIFRFVVAAALVLSVVSCGKTTIRLNLDTPGEEVIVKEFDVNRFITLDTLKTSSDGSLNYNVDVVEGEPEFIYLSYGKGNLLPLIVLKGDNIKVTADSLGNYSVEGSEESALFQQVEADLAAFKAELDSYNPTVASELRAAGKSYVKYYRSRMKYVMEHPKSMTVVPVLFQKCGNMEIFGTKSDAIRFSNAADSLESVYPNSKYVKALRAEATKRMNALELQTYIENAEELAYPEISLPDLSGSNVSFTAVKAKVKMLYFWSSISSEQKTFNLDQLEPLYKEFHDKGFEIYAVSLDTDKTAWATAVREQNLPWINVCDTHGASSSYLGLYNVTSLPRAYFIVNDELDVNAQVSDAQSIRNYLRSKLN